MNSTNNKSALSHDTPSKTTHANSSSAHDQRARLLAWLQQHGQIDTVTARHELDILCPAARVLELRQRGHGIETIWIDRTTDCGKLHRVALYVLKPGGRHE